MALFPRIDEPCPLGSDELKRIDGHCSRCNKTVHSLDGMSDAQRIAFVRDAKGPLCVSYRVPERRHAAGFGAALALSIAAPAFATDNVSTIADGGPELRSVDSAHTSPFAPNAQVSGPRCGDTMIQASFDPQAPPAGESLETIIVTGGGIRPRAVDWIDTTAPPAASSFGEGGKLESITAGGVNRPADAAWVDDSDLPDLPMVRSGETE